MDGKDLDDFTPHAPFRTASGLQGWWLPESFIVWTQRFGGLLRLDVPPAQGATINLDRTYGTMILLGLNTTQPQRRLRAFQERLLLALGKSTNQHTGSKAFFMGFDCAQACPKRLVLRASTVCTALRSTYLLDATTRMACLPR